MKHYSEIIKKVIADSNEKCEPNANQPKPDEKDNTDRSSINTSQANNQENKNSKNQSNPTNVVTKIFRFAKTSYNTIYRSIRHFNLKK